MRIERLHIYGFGHLTDVVLQFAANGIHVLYGPNEAGKTTLLAFIRAILFGFDSSKTKNRYEPVHASKYGGKIIFQTSVDSMNGPVTIERTFHGRALRGDVHVYDHAGRTLSEDTFIQDQLKHLSAQVYQSIYAFGLGELEDFQSLSSQDIQARIHSAGMGLGSVSPIEIEKKLENKKLSLYRKRGQDQPLSQLLRKKQELRRSLQQLSVIPGQYTQLQQELDLLKEKMEQLKQQKRMKEIERDQSAMYEQLRQLWEEIAPLETVLADLPELPVCTREMLYQWETLQREQQVLEKRLQAYSQQIESDNRKIAAIQTEEMWNEHWDAIARLYESRHVFTEWDNQCQKLILELQQFDVKLQNILGQLQHSSDVTEWQQIPTTFVTYEELRTFEQNRISHYEHLTLQQAQTEQLQKEFDMAAEEYEELTGRLQGLLDASGKAGFSLEQLQNAVKKLQLLFPELQQLIYRRIGLDEQIGQLQQDLNRVQQIRFSRKQKSKLQQSNGYYIGMFLIIFTVIAITGIFWPVVRTVMIGTAFAALLLGGAVFIINRKQMNLHSTDPFSSETERIRLLLQQAETNRIQLAADIEAKTLQIQTLAGQFGVKVNGQDLQQLQHVLDQLTQWMFRQRVMAERIELLRAQQQDCARKQGKLQTRLQEAKQKLEQFQLEWEHWHTGWQDWLKTHRLPETLTPGGARQYLQLVERAKECLENQQHRENELKQYQQEMEHFKQEVHSIQKKLLLEPASQREIVIVVQGLYEKACQNRIKCSQKAELEQSLQQTLEEQKHTEEALQRHLQSIDAWLQANGFLNSKQVTESFEHSQKKQQLEEQLHFLYLKLEAKIGSRELLDQHLLRVREKDLAAWHRFVQEAERELECIQAELEECKRMQGQLENEISRLEASTERSELQQQMQVVEAEIKDLATEWSIYTIAQKFLELARQKYERERQPSVLKKASAMFQVITGERYAHVRSPIVQPEIRVITKEHTSLSTFSLSRGTAEQLYLAMRFALIDELLQKGMQAPVIMDDVLVNFDPERLQATIQVLENMADHHQILFLTCHPHILHSLQTLIRSCQIIEFFYGRQDFTVQQKIQ